MTPPASRAAPAPAALTASSTSNASAASNTSAPPGASPATPQWRGLLAAIDIGSNSFRLEIGQWRAGRYRRDVY